MFTLRVSTAGDKGGVCCGGDLSELDGGELACNGFLVAALEEEVDLTEVSKFFFCMSVTIFRVHRC